MILNKVSVTSVLLESVVRGHSESNGLKEAVLALKSLDELSGWIKFLQTARDLRETIGLFNDNRKMNDRCQRICGNSEKNCFISNRNQLLCISDMILTKVSVTSMLLESVVRGHSESNGSKEAVLALKSLDELTGWIKFLQMAHDLRETIGLFNENRIAEKRKERRYPLPEIYQKYIGLNIQVHGSVRSVLLVNFSPSGMQFRSPEYLAVGSVTEGSFFTEGHPIKREASFIAIVRHCLKHEEGFDVGVQITAVQDDSSLNFFMDVHDFIVMALSEEQ